MPNEPLALPDILAALPDEADYEAVYAAVMASERGRGFLTEYASRNRHADTQMLVAAIAHVEAAVRGEPLPQASAAARDLIEIAVAIDRIAAVIAADKAPDIFAAIERIQDIAFVLHERPVEARLCDALDAAIREISAALAPADSARSGTRGASELLHALAGRVREMIGRSAPDQIMALPEKPAVGPDEATPVTKNEDAVLFDSVIEFVTPRPEALLDPEEDGGDETIAQARATPAVPLPTSVADAKTVIEVVPTDNAAAERSTGEVHSSDDILSDALSVGHFSGKDPLGDNVSGAETPSDTAPSEEQPGEASSSSQTGSAEPTAGLEEDPAELFDPLPMPSPVTPPPAALVSEAAVPTDIAEVPTPVVQPERPILPQFTAAAALRAVPSLLADDPLAAVRALSEEELIALFS
jgi:hypothetical protein